MRCGKMVVKKMNTLIRWSIGVYLLIFVCIAYLFTIKQPQNTTVFISCSCHNNAADDTIKCPVDMQPTSLTVLNTSEWTRIMDTRSTEDRTVAQSISQSQSISTITGSRNSAIVTAEAAVRSPNTTHNAKVSLNVTQTKRDASTEKTSIASPPNATQTNSPAATDETHKVFQKWMPYVASNTLLHMGNTLSKKMNISSLKKINLVAYIKQLQKYKVQCRSVYNHILEVKEVIPRFYGNCSGPYPPNAVSLVIHMDHHKDYWSKVKAISESWDGPISLAVFVKDDPPADLSYLDIIRNDIRNFHVQDDYMCLHMVRAPRGTSGYSINTLRNIASRFAPTNRIFMMDIDFLPHLSLQQKLRGHIDKSGGINLKAFVIPAFAVKSSDATIPRNKSELLEQWTKKNILPVHETKSFKRGHVTTNYNKWRAANATYQVTYKASYEPYYVTDRRSSPYYPEEFAFGAKDKGSHAYLLNKLGFTFLILPDVFIIHTKHNHQYSTHQSKRDITCGYYNERELDKTLPTPRPPPPHPPIVSKNKSSTPVKPGIKNKITPHV